ncbi:MAG: ATP synthase subunit I [Clostridia bacterium]|nr:ATP synthase subunit I [Clostridia bacterium]
MQKIDKIVWKETKYIAAWVLVLSAIMQAVFLVIDRWDVTVLLGNVLSGVAVVANFFAMALAVQRAVAEEEKQARQTMRVSNAVRMLAMFAVLAVGVLLPLFNTWTVIVPFVFPRLIVAVRPALDRAKQKKGGRA